MAFRRQRPHYLSAAKVRRDAHTAQIRRQLRKVADFHAARVIQTAIVAVVAHAVGIRADLPRHVTDVRREALPLRGNASAAGFVVIARAEARDDQVIVTPLLKNAGNSVIRPLTSLKVTNSSGVAVVDLPQKESLAVLGGAELMQPLVLEIRLAAGTYNVK